MFMNRKAAHLNPLQESELQAIHGRGGGGSKPASRAFTPFDTITYTREIGHAESPASIQAREMQRRQAEIQRLQQMAQRNDRLRDPHYHLPQFRNGR